MRRLIPGLLLWAIATSPAFLWAQKVTVEYDESKDFSHYKTFAIRDGQLHSKNPALNSDLVRKKIDGEIRKRLTERGLTEVSAQPDLNVRYSLGSANRREVDTYPAGWRGLGRRRVTVHYTEGTLILDLRDPKTRELVWRAIAVEDKSDGAKLAGRLDEMVKKSVEKYPPKK